MENGMKKIWLLFLIVLSGCNLTNTNNRYKVYYNVNYAYLDEKCNDLTVLWGNYEKGEYYVITPKDTFEYINVNKYLSNGSDRVYNIFYVFSYKYRLVIGK